MKLSKNTEILLIIVIFTLSIFQVSYRIGDEQIKVWDESSSARNGVEMLHSGNYLFATIDGKPDYHDVKPPLQLWAKVISYKMFGINEFSARFPTLVSYFMLLLVLFFFTRKYLKSVWLSLLLVIFPAITYGFSNYHVAWHGDTELLLILLTTMYILAAFFYINEYPKNKLKTSILLSILVFLAFFTKSIAGIAPAIGIVIYATFFKRKVFKDVTSYLPVILFIILLVVYYGIVELYAPGYFSELIERHLTPFTEYKKAIKHPEFIFYIKFLFEKGLYPFLYWIPITLVPLIFSKNKKILSLIKFLIIVSVAFLIGQSSALMKNAWYIAPIYPLLWLVLAISIYETYMIIKQRLFQKSILIKPLTYILLSVVIFSFGHNYKKVFQQNEARYSGYIYELERDGKFLDNVISWNNKIKNITILTDLPHGEDRQLDFYIKKHRYFSNMEISTQEELSDNIINKYVLTTQKKYIKAIKNRYSYKLVYKSKYGYLFYINPLKQDKIIDNPKGQPIVYINYYKKMLSEDSKLLKKKVKKYNTNSKDEIAIRMYQDINNGKTKEEILSHYQSHISKTYYENCLKKSAKQNVSVDSIIKGDAIWYFDTYYLNSSKIKTHFPTSTSFEMLMQKEINYGF